MNINDLIKMVKKKIQNSINLESIQVEDKTFLHKNHIGQKEGKFHLKIKIQSNELKKLNKIDSNKKVYKILDEEMKKFIHSIQILVR